MSQTADSVSWWRINRETCLSNIHSLLCYIYYTYNDEVCLQIFPSSSSFSVSLCSHNNKYHNTWPLLEAFWDELKFLSFLFVFLVFGSCFSFSFCIFYLRVKWVRGSFCSWQLTEVYFAAFLLLVWMLSEIGLFFYENGCPRINASDSMEKKSWVGIEVNSFFDLLQWMQRFSLA